MLGQTSLLVGQLFCKGGRKWGTPLTMSDVPPLVYLWSCENLQHCWKHFLASKITKMSELVGNLFLFFVVPSLVGLFSFQFLWCTTPHHTAAGDHPSTKKRN
jgi:fatty acid desaturase